jgi:1-acyl-sn-glycerol-3-phosphate acyltransferase
MNFFNAIQAFGFYLFSTWITPWFLIPFAIIDRKTNYWEINYKFWLFTMLGTKFKYVNDAPVLKRGFIISNHRSWGDFMVDPLISSCKNVSRHTATFAILPGALLAMLSNYIISINRNKSRQEIFQRITKNMTNPILFYPEGTRKNYTNLESLDKTKEFIKPGLLKSIYEYKKYPIQLQISNNKENVLNEKKMKINCNVTVTIFLSEPIYPMDYQTFDEFYNEICVKWFEQFNHVYQIK